MKLIIKALTLVFFTYLFTGCGAISIDKNLVKQYKKPIKINSNETLVYVIRESSFAGAARGLWVAHNNNVIGDIGSGEYTYFKVKKGINTINTVQAKTGLAYYAIDEVSKEPLFLKFSYTKGTVEKLPTDLGISYIANYKESKNLENKHPNDGYINGLVNLAMIENLEIMSETNTTLVPDENNAVITFIRPSSFASMLKYTIWSDNGIVGNLDTNTYFQIKVPTGKYHYYVKSQIIYALEANVSANKNYIIELDVNMGWTTAHVQLDPIDANNYNNPINNNGTLKHLVLNKNLPNNIQERIQLALPIIKEYTDKVASGDKKPEVLKSSFGK